MRGWVKGKSGCHRYKGPHLMYLSSIHFLGGWRGMSQAKNIVSNEQNGICWSKDLALLTQWGKFPVVRTWSNVLCSPKPITARCAALKPFPYTADESVIIWFLKNLLSFPSNGDLASAEAEVVAMLLSDMYSIWDSNHMLAMTWHMPSSTCWLRPR